MLQLAYYCNFWTDYNYNEYNMIFSFFFVGGRNIDPNWKYYSHWKNIPQSCTIIKTHKQKYENYELVSGVGAERRGDGETNFPLNTKNVIRIKDI